MSKFCCKYILRNNSNKLATFNYKRFKDSIWQYQVELKPNQIKSIFLEIETYSTPFSTIEIIEKITQYTRYSIITCCINGKVDDIS
jgi:hypothetical protein